MRSIKKRYQEPPKIITNINSINMDITQRSLVTKHITIIMETAIKISSLKLGSYFLKLPCTMVFTNPCFILQKIMHTFTIIKIN